MLTLKTQLSTLREQYEIKSHSSSVEVVLNKYQKIMVNFLSLALTARQLKKRAEMLSQLPENVPHDFVMTEKELDSLKVAHQHLQSFMAILQQDGEQASQNHQLGVTENALAGSNTTLAKKINDTWQSFLEHHKSLALQDKAIMDQLMHLQPDVYHAYYEQEKIFLQTIKMSPDSPVVADKIIELTKNLMAIKTKMQPDAPPEVLAFLTALNTEQRAPLNLLTPRVMDWLEKHDIQSSMVVIRKGLHG
ncbi:TPA: hypothetical protein JG889_004151 [Enterobacter hormaechei subsp. steigerwaltii]|uniref:hypothetical protein n=1 Tax=Enterobacteriaceae TaxID=543 RepID=UPI0025783700|nr:MULTISPECIES: hypothetical protein [Enterobacteriaceae]HAV1877455.1 hypothetical protein [Enterobacter hormaechei subsp. steigerwaltii]HCC5975962.1 hypothetical protein [Citrobacter koseri]MDM2970893.1 hypothetical protein [Citrobacter sp. CK199]MDM2979085.1 hypothetical protein [Citrobacter sp. CK200]MEB6655744.1 hypothetical protein [Klebsiella aerogenes]